jgi:hypothetical protein
VFTVTVVDPCPTATIKLAASLFQDSTYEIGKSEIRQTWTNSELGTLSTQSPCGSLEITQFYTKLGATVVPLNSKLF